MIKTISPWAVATCSASWPGYPCCRPTEEGQCLIKGSIAVLHRPAWNRA